MMDYRDYEDSYQEFMTQLTDKVLEYGLKAHLEMKKFCIMTDLLGETIRSVYNSVESVVLRKVERTDEKS